MARALTEKTRADQRGRHRVASAITHESTCTRCGGLMVTDFSMDVLYCIGETECAAQRCVQCGEIVDPVILRNRGTKQNPVTAQSAGKMVPNNRVTNGRDGFALQAPWDRLSLCPESRKPDPAAVDDRHGEAMRPEDHSRDTEAGFFSLTKVGRRFRTASPAERDRPLFSPRRGLSARCAMKADDKKEGAGLSAVMRWGIGFNTQWFSIT
jgi:hypothetical protein